jgi:hypothetical protein
MSRIQQNYTESELRALDRKTLTLVATYNGIAVKASPALISLNAKKPIKPGDSLLANRILNSSDYKTTVHVRPENYLNTHGGHTEFEPVLVRHKNLAGKSVVRDNLPLPLPFGVDMKYDNLSEVSALCAQIVKNMSGMWVSAISTASWQKVYAQGVNPVGMQAVAQFVCELLSQSSMWRAMTTIQHNGVQGPELLSFVTTTLNSLGQKDWDELNTMIVLYGLQVMEKHEDHWVMWKDDQDQPIVPRSVWQSIKPTEETKSLLTVYPAILKYKGGIPMVVKFPEKLGTFKNALAAQSLLREVQGSDGSCTSLLSAMKGYSGMTDDFGRRIAFTCSAVLHCWSMGRGATVQLETVGDLPMLISSTNYWKRQIELGTIVFPKNEKKFSFDLNNCVVGFMLPGVGDNKKVVGTLRKAVVHKPLEGSVVIMYDPGTLPTSEAKGKPADYEGGSRDLFPKFCEKYDFILYSMIFGDYPFPQDREVVRERANGTIPFKPLSEVEIDEEGKETSIVTKIYVYRHGSAAGFRGVLSSLPLSLIGFGHTPIHKTGTVLVSGYDMTQKTMHRIPLEQVLSRAEWYNRVILDCEAQSVIFGNPVIRYSGISNLAYQSKAAAQLNLSMVPLEDGVASGMIAFRRKGVRVEERVDFSVHDEEVETTAQRSFVKLSMSSSSMTSPPVQEEYAPQVQPQPQPMDAVPYDADQRNLEDFFADTLEDTIEEEGAVSTPGTKVDVSDL